MIEITRYDENLYSFPIELPENPLKWLNCYVIRGANGGRNLMIDTGFHRRECFESLMAGMRLLQLKPAETDVFLTHLHSDHCGNAGMLQKMGCRLLMGQVDYERFVSGLYSGWGSATQRALSEGMPEDVIHKVFENNPAVLYSSEYFTVDNVKDGDVLTYADFNLRVIACAGHTPGQMCLYDPDKKLMFTGDHVLFDITSNVGIWPGMENSLGVYLENLKKVDALDIETALPAHRNVGNITIHERIAQLLEHHERRLAEVIEILRENPGFTGYEIAGHMTWKIQANNWEEFPPGQKWFAFVETLAHLDYLLGNGKIFSEESGGQKGYFIQTER